MAALDLRAGRLDLSAHPGNAYTLTLSWPTGGLVGTDWTATLDGDPVDSVTVDGDDLVVVMTMPATPGVYDLTLTDVSTAPDTVSIVGKVRADGRGSSASSSATVTVTRGSATAEVTVVGGSTSTIIDGGSPSSTYGGGLAVIDGGEA